WLKAILITCLITRRWSKLIWGASGAPIHRMHILVEQNSSSISPFLVVDDVDVHYGAVQALFGVSLQVGRGEVVSVLGGNASGKSTTLKTVLGLVSPSRGRVVLEGREIQGLS